MDEIFNTLITFVSPILNSSMKQIIKTVTESFRTNFSASFPQEYEAVKQTDRWLTHALKKSCKWPEISKHAKQIFLSYEETGRTSDRCNSCQYLMPFLLDEGIRKWDIPIRKLEFNLVSYQYSLAKLYPGLQPVLLFPNTIETIAATANHEEIRKSTNQQEFLYEHIVKFKPTVTYVDKTAMDVSVSKLEYLTPKKFEKNVKKYWHGFMQDFPEIFALYINSELREVIYSLYIIWDVENGERQLFVDKRFLKDEYQQILRIALRLFDLLDCVITPILYSTTTYRACSGSKKCPILNALLNNNPASLKNSNAWITTSVLNDKILKNIEGQKGQLQSDFKSLIEDLKGLGEKTIKRVS